MTHHSAIAADGYDASLAWIERLPEPIGVAFERGLADLSDSVKLAEQDGLNQLIPVMLAAAQPVPALRLSVGRTTWRQIHHATEAINLLRSLVWLRFDGVVTWQEIVAIPSHHLRSCRNAYDWPTGQFAAQHAPEGGFQKYAMLYRDVVKLGATPQPHWTPARFRREKDRLFSASRISDADPARWATPATFRYDGFTFTRLCSDRDLVTEGIAMRHCVASYAATARAGTTLVFRCEGRERATASLTPDLAIELRGFANADVSAACLAAARALRTRCLSH